MDVEWYEKKAASNFLKHGVTFEEAVTALADPLALTFSEPRNDEDRSITFGHSSLTRLLVVVTIERLPDCIRVISARRATPKEKRDYEKAI